MCTNDYIRIHLLSACLLFCLIGCQFACLSVRRWTAQCMGSRERQSQGKAAESLQSHEPSDGPRIQSESSFNAIKANWPKMQHRASNTTKQMLKDNSF